MKKSLSTAKKFSYWFLINIALFLLGCLGIAINEILSYPFIFACSISVMIFVPSLIICWAKCLLRYCVKSHKSPEKKHVVVYNHKFATSSYCYNERKTYSTNGEDVSWLKVLLICIICLPYGIFFMILKFSEEKNSYYMNGVKSIIIGTFIMIITAPVLMYVLTSFDTALKSRLFLAFLPFTCFISGLSLALYGYFLKEKGKTYDAFMIHITNDEITSIPELEKKTGKKYHEVTNVIQELTEAELLPNAYIYHKDKEVIVPGISKKIALKCNSCNGTTVLYSNDKHICRYCGVNL